MFKKLKIYRAPSSKNVRLAVRKLFQKDVYGSKERVQKNIPIGSSERCKKNEFKSSAVFVLRLLRIKTHVLYSMEEKVWMNFTYGMETDSIVQS